MERGDISKHIERMGRWHSLRNIKVNGGKTECRVARSQTNSAASVYETRVLGSELCQQFYALGWVSGTGGSVTIKVHDDATTKSQQLIVMSPSGVQKERMNPEDMYVLSSDGLVLSTPPCKAYPNKQRKCSDSTPLFLQVYEICNAGAVIHSHGIESCLVTMINPLMKEFRITHMEMIKGIKGHGYHDELVVPIIENTAEEGELKDSLTQAIRCYPKASAVLVRNHGVYIWGDTWITAKTHAECYHYLFDAAVKLYQLGLDWSSPHHGPICNADKRLVFSNGLHQTMSLASDVRIDPPQQFILITIEGTVGPVSFLEDDKDALRSEDHTCRTGFQCSNILGRLYDDVPKALERWHSSGIKIYSYGHCNRKVQQFVFCNSSYGDLRMYLSGYFDATFGSTTDEQTYKEILLTIGVNKASDMLFVTDNVQQAFSAKAAGLKVILAIRSGNEPLVEHHGFRTVESMLEVC